jgi:hypothetical protein
MKDIEKAIVETLVIENKQSLHIAMAKIEKIIKQQLGKTWDAAINAHEERGHVIARSICDFDEYYETLTQPTNK